MNDRSEVRALNGVGDLLLSESAEVFVSTRGGDGGGEKRNLWMGEDISTGYVSLSGLGTGTR